KMKCEVGDGEDLAVSDGCCDAVVATFGGMFSPDQDRTAEELVRVCKPGGRIGLANCTPEGFIGQMFKTIGKYLPPPTGVKSPAVWGTRSLIGTTFRAAASTLAAEPSHFGFGYCSTQDLPEKLPP